MDDNTVIEWSITDNGEPKINFRQKVTLKDVAWIVKKENDTSKDWNIDKGIYLNE